ncbi:sema domain, transmembrane domain (TM), and cytoplasmic domain, (semaphorin) 6D, like isoform X5 [Synchiropus splendidus]|uniref:sema domain, transmembrane domain (TM), and cytoplasmic domain, (semaphorin) 6D, like isoform X5 n=1 Tax=Synchiropus splendidus TaxID=270530 RepID=UPI00237E5162|nr:sema domain, transmembrane domain (TM), and cytoplasmic domain, (semaphorin) 6D, like isoform X5 [Synchiropus splendidus]
MGQVAVRLLLLLLTASHTLLAVSFPEDLVPHDVVDAQFSRRYPVFRGRPSGNESQHRLDFQLMTKIQDTLFIAGRDQVYLVSLRESYRNEIIPYRKLTWRSGKVDREQCALKGKHKDDCHNFIKVLVPGSDDLVFICGTNSFNPKCRYYRLDNLEFDGEDINGAAKCPFDPRQTNVALFAEGKLFSATVTDFQATDSVIYRSMGDGSPIRTIKYDSKWLKEPHFLHAAEYGNYVYFFYREIAVEHSNLGKVVYSRVARVCKNDNGGSQRVLEKHWTSFVKARLNCSVPGESFFYFDVLQSITDITMNGAPAVVGVFTTQMNSIPGSAVCAFSMADIEKVFMGRFKEQKTADSVWTPFPEDKLPSPRPGCCAGQGSASSISSSVGFPDATLQFIKSHPLMDASVPSIGDEPWYTKTRVRYRLTALAVDNEAGPHKNHTVVFIGAESGVILKVLAKTSATALNDSVLLEEIDVFNKDKCLSNREDDKRVLSMHVDKDAHSLYVAFSSCVIRIPLSRCERHSSCHKACIASRDPYCGWKPNGVCERIQPGVLRGYEQDVEGGNTTHLAECQDVWAVQASTSNQMVHMNILITCVFAAFLTGALLSGIAVFWYRDVTRKAPRNHTDTESGPSNSHSTGSFVKLNGLFDSPVKEYQTNMDAPKLYSNLLSNDKALTTPGCDTKTMILRDACQPPDLTALPTPDSTPVLQQKGLQPIKNQWERAHGKASGPRKENNTSAKSPQFLPSSPGPPIANSLHPHPSLGHSHIPSAVVLPNATHDHPKFDNGDETLPHSSERKIKNPEFKGKKEQKKSVDARNTLNDILKHLNDSVANPKAILQEGSGPRPRPHLTLETMEEMMELPPKVPSREASLYSPSSSLPRHSPTKRVDVPLPTTPTTPTGSLSMGGTLERQRGGYQLHRSASHRQSLSTSPSGITMGVSLSRQHSMNRGGYMPPTPPSRLDSHSGVMGAGLHPGHPPTVSRQSSYSGHGSLPRTGLKRTPSLKPDVPPKPNGFSPQTPQMRVVNKYSY